MGESALEFLEVVHGAAAFHPLPPPRSVRQGFTLAWGCSGPFPGQRPLVETKAGLSGGVTCH